MATTYTAKDITVLEGLEPVRKRPGMYIGGVGTAGLHHLVWEILDNAVDEAMNGYASNIVLTLHEWGKDSLFLAHTLVGRVIFFLIVVGIYWAVLTGPTLTQIRSGLKFKPAT